MNLLRLSGPMAALAGIAVEASIAVQEGSRQRVEVCFRRGGWLGPTLGGSRLQWLRNVKQSFPAWLDITVLDADLRVCRGNAGTLFALTRRHDLNLADLLLTELTTRASASAAPGLIPGPACPSDRP